MSLKVTDSGPSIVQLSTCFKNLLLKLKVHSAASFINNFLKISFEQTGTGIFVNNDSTPYDTSSSSSCKNGIEGNMLGHH